MLTRYPELFGAVWCSVPLLDMARYTKLLAGQSWIAEYGDPEIPQEWEFIQRTSPYHLARADRNYPPILITTKPQPTTASIPAMPARWSRGSKRWDPASGSTRPWPAAIRAPSITPSRRRARRSVCLFAADDRRRFETAIWNVLDLFLLSGS